LSNDEPSFQLWHAWLKLKGNEGEEVNYTANNSRRKDILHFEWIPSSYNLPNSNTHLSPSGLLFAHALATVQRSKNLYLVMNIYIPAAIKVYHIVKRQGACVENVTFNCSNAVGDWPRRCTTMAIKSEVVSYPPKRESNTKLTFSSSDKVSTLRSISRKSFLKLLLFLDLLSSIIALTLEDILLLACKEGSTKSWSHAAFFLKQEKKEPHNYWNCTLLFWSKQKV